VSGAVRLAIGVPTRNRAELAIAAVESVLAAAQPGVRVFVSDNSTDAGEADRLAAFCAAHGDEVRYLRPPEPLEMAPHWEWLRHEILGEEWATHVAYLTDRLVFTRGSLDEVLRVTAQEPEQVVSYHHDRVEDRTSPVALVQTQWTGRVLELDARRLIELSSRGLWGDHLPRMLNCVVPVGRMDAIERRFGGVFAPVSPDYRFAYRCLATCDSVLYLDRPCLIEYGMQRSAGINYLKGHFNRDAASFAEDLSIPRFGATPEPRFEAVANALFQEYCSVRAETDGGRFPPADRRSYLAAVAASVALIEEPQWRERMEALLREHGWTRRDRVRRALAETLAMIGYFVRHPVALARSVKRQLWERPPGTPLANLLAKMGVDAPERDDLYFASSREAIEFANAHPRPPRPYAWNVHRLERAGAIVRRFRPVTAPR
jgi:hypothetical protein